MGRHSERRTLKVSGFLAPYDPTVFPENECSNDLVASVLGAAVDGWVPELLYRYTLYRGLYIDWAIMIYARPADGDRQRRAAGLSASTSASRKSTSTDSAAAMTPTTIRVSAPQSCRSTQVTKLQ